MDRSLCVHHNTAGLPVCVICGEKLRQTSVLRHFQKHTTFAKEYPAEEARRRAIEEGRAEQSYFQEMDPQTPLLLLVSQLGRLLDVKAIY